MSRTAWIGFLFAGLFTSSQGQDMNVTVYNQNLALIREKRDMNISKGVSTISFTDVAAQINPTSVHFKSLNSDRMTILEQNFEFDLVNSQKVLQKYVDEQVRVITKKGEMFEGRLLSAQSDLVIERSEGILILKNSEIQHFDFPSLPEGLITRPTLVWLVKNDGGQKHQTELSYLTGGMSWQAEYVAVADAADENLDLSGWVSIENRCGATFTDARLKLIAGDVHRVQPPGRSPFMERQDLRVAKAAEAQFEEKSFFEYHMYTLQRKSTLKNNQTKQISLFPPARTSAEKIYIYDGSRYQKKVNVHFEFMNRKKDGLGLPLPKGVIRIYKEDTGGALEFIGEDQIDHTPVDEKVRMYLGNAFDLVGERVEKSVRRISDRSREQTVEITLRNHKNEGVEILALEHFWGDWSLTKTTVPAKKKTANTAEFEVRVPAKSETKLTFTVLYRW